MNPFTDASGHARPGDAPFFKSLADQYAISDNYHQAIMGGTGANFQALVTGHAAFFTNPDRPDGSPAVPFANQIENPDPVPGTNNYYKQDGYAGGSYVNCSDPSAPGVAAITEQLLKNGVHEKNCAPNHYYLVNNYNMYWNQTSNRPNLLGPDKFILPPQSAPTIADVMTAKRISWKYYSSDRGSDITAFARSVDGVPLPFHFYCGICDPLTGFINIMTKPSEEAKLQNYGAFIYDVTNNTLPAVSFVRPFEALAGHPADSTTDLYELVPQHPDQPGQGQPAALGQDRHLHHHRRRRRLLRLRLRAAGRLPRRRHPNSLHRGVSVRQAGARRSHLLRSRFAPEVHRTQLAFAENLRRQPRSFAESGAQRRRQSLWPGQPSGHRRSHEPVHLRQGSRPRRRSRS
jgi:phospholipase C